MYYTDRLTCSVTSSEMYFNAGDSIMTLLDRVCAHILAAPSSLETRRSHRSGEGSAPCGDRIATATWEQNSIRLCDNSDGRLLLNIPDRVSSPYNTPFAWSNNGQQLFVASHAGKIKCFHVPDPFSPGRSGTFQFQTDNRPAYIALAVHHTHLKSFCLVLGPVNLAHTPNWLRHRA